MLDSLAMIRFVKEMESLKFQQTFQESVMQNLIGKKSEDELEKIATLVAKKLQEKDNEK
jgi:hypothetical protein